MQFVPGLPQGVYVGQTRVHHAKVQPSAQPELAGFNLALHVQDNALRVQQHRMALLQDFAAFGVDKITWMTQTHSTICHSINEQMPFTALVGDGLVTQRKAHALMMMTADCLPVVMGKCERYGSCQFACRLAWSGGWYCRKYHRSHADSADLGLAWGGH